MPWLSILGLIGKPIIKLWENRQNKRFLLDKMRQITDGKMEVTDSEIRLMQARMSGDSYRDEFWCRIMALLWVSQFLSVWWPSFADAGERMVNIVGQDAYSYILLSAVAASFGMRAWKN